MSVSRRGSQRRVFDGDTVREPSLADRQDHFRLVERGAVHITSQARCGCVIIAGTNCDYRAHVYNFLGRHDGFTVVQSYSSDVTAHLAFASALEWRCTNDVTCTEAFHLAGGKAGMAQGDHC